MGRPFYAVIIPLGEGGHPDQGLPGGGYYPDQGLPGGPETDPPYPDQGLPGRPPHVGNRPPGSWNRPEYPSQGPVRPGRPVDPGYEWGGRPPRPGNRPPGSWDRPEHPSTGPVLPDGRPIDPGYGIDADLGPAHPWVPPAGEELPPPPAEIADQIVVAVWKPEDQQWKVAVAQGPHPAPNG
jgi:hypothetical protein